jgi:hypothetical protein
VKKYITVVFIFSLSIISAQKSDTIKNKLKISGSYEGSGQWYTNDVNRNIKHDSVPLRSNNYLSLNASLGKFSAGIQIEAYANKALLNYNPKYSKTNIGTYFANYKSEKLDVTLGYFYEQFGSGLAFRSWEDRSLGINNAIRGGKVTYTPINELSITALYGQQRTGFDVSKGKISGINAELEIMKLLFPSTDHSLSYGISFVNRNEELPADVTGFNKNTYIISNRLALEKGKFYINFEQDYKSKDALLNSYRINYRTIKSGSAFLANFGYSDKGFGIDANLRRIENMLFLSERKPEIYSPGNISLNYNDKLINYIPSLTKQHHSNLANIYIYQAQSITSMQFDEQIEKFGEIGGQLDLFYNFKKGTVLGGKYGTKIAVNLANWYNLKADHTYFDASENFAPNYKTQFLAAGQRYFSEYSLDIDKKINPKLIGNLSIINQYYNNQYIKGIYQKYGVNSTILFAEATMLFSNSKSLKISAEHLWTKTDRKNWIGGTLEYAHNSKFSFFVTDMYNYGFDPNEHLINPTDLFDIHFYNLGTTYRNGSTRVSLNYGRQRGGLVCAGGICRYVPPSTGLGLQINTSF